MVPPSELRSGSISRPRVLIAAMVAVAAIALAVFAPWRPPYFVSDSWTLLRLFGLADVFELLGRLAPSPGEWYRPLTELGYWVTWQLFGLDPLGHYLVHVTAHVVTAVLVGLVALHVAKSRAGGLVAGVAFLFALQAHEVVWDYSALHFTLSAPFLVASVLAYIRGARVLAVTLGAVTLMFDEAGLLVLPMAGLYEALFGVGRRKPVLAAARRAGLRLAPLIALVGVYLAARVVIGQGFYNEVSQTCWTVGCLGTATLEYFNRLVVRGEPLVATLWLYRYVVAAVTGTLLLGLLALARPWRWGDLRPVAFGIGWASGASLFFVLALWPYVADRFLYIPVAGVCIALGAGVAEMARAWPTSRALAQTAALGVGVVVAAWIALGALTNLERGQRWVDAGSVARDLAMQVNALVPDPAPGSYIVLYGMPRFDDPTFPPGNTGPYVYLNGMTSAMSLLYGWRGVVIPPVPDAPFEVPSDIAGEVIFLRLVGETVIRLPGPLTP